MKRSIGLALVWILCLLVVGCSKETTTQKTEEQLIAELEEELRIKEEENKPIKDKSSENDSLFVKDQKENMEEQEEKVEIKEGDLYQYATDMEHAIDLNNDGHLDTIVYSNNEKGAYMTINEKQYQFDDGFFEMIYNRFRVVDIDTSDPFVEIVLRETEPPYDKRLIFYRYDGKDFYSIGSIMIQNYINREKNELITEGNGEITVAGYSHIMNDGIYYKEYRIGSLGNIEAGHGKGLCTYINPIKSRVNKEVKGYKGRSTEESYIKIVQGEEFIIYGEIDNWLKIQWEDKELWINGEELTHFSPDPKEKFEFEGILFWS